MTRRRYISEMTRKENWRQEEISALVEGVSDRLEVIASAARSKNQCAREKERAKPTVHQTKFFVYVSRLNTKVWKHATNLLSLAKAYAVLKTCLQT